MLILITTVRFVESIQSNGSQPGVLSPKGHLTTSGVIFLLSPLERVVVVPLASQPGMLQGIHNTQDSTHHRELFRSL